MGDLFLFSSFSVLRHMVDDDDDVELNVLGCRFDILGTNCNGAAHFGGTSFIAALY